MKLLSLHLENIRSYIDQKIEFPNNLLLIGDIGSGKSTILQSIEFALFGAQRGILDANHLLRMSAKEGSVTLTFQLNDQRIISVKRVLKLKKTSVSQEAGYLEIDNLREEYMPTELRSRILAILGYPDMSSKSKSMIYRYSVYATQEQMKQIILERPETRLDTLRVIFGVDKYKQIIENSTLYQRIIKKNIAYLEGQLVNFTTEKLDLAETKMQLQKLHNDRKEILSSVEKKKHDLQKVTNDLEEVSSHLKEFAFVQEKIKTINANKNALKNKLDALNQEKHSVDKAIQNHMNESANIIIEQTNDSYENISKDISLLQEKISTHTTKKESLQEKIVSQKEDLASLTKDCDELKDITKEKDSLFKEIKEVKGQITFLEQKISEKESLQTKKEQIQKNIAEISLEQKQKTDLQQNISSLDICPTCKQKVGDNHKHKFKTTNDEDLQKLALRLDEYEKSLEKTNKLLTIIALQEKEFQQLKETNITQENTQKNIIQAEEKLREITKKISLLRDLLQESETNLNNLLSIDIQKEKDLLLSLQKQEKQLQEKELHKQKKKHLDELVKTKSDRLTAILKEIKEQEQNMKEQNEALLKLKDQEKVLLESTKYVSLLTNMKKEARNSYEEALKQQEKITTSINHYQKQQEKQECIIQERTKTKKDKDWLEHFSSWLTQFFAPLMKVMETQVLQQIYQDFAAKFSYWFSILIEDETLSATIDEQFTPKVSQNGYDLDIDSMSGGERTSVALAYRLTLNKIVNDLIGLQTKDLLILDEPTEGFSTEQLDRVRDVLEQISVSQLIIVSHEQKVDGFVENVMRVEKEQGESKIFGL